MVPSVTWSVTGSESGTFIGPNGMLTVASDETAEYLTITATSTADPSVSGSLELDIYPLGDLNKSRTVDIQDVMALCRVIARKAADQEPTEEEIFLGSLDGDMDIAITDVMALCRVLARNSQ